MATGSTSNPTMDDDVSAIHPIPSSIIIVNESSPLLSQDQQLAGGSLHVDTSFHPFACIALSPDEEQRDRELIGLFLLLISSLCFTGVSVMVKLLDPFPWFEIVFARSCIQFPLGLIGCCICRANPLGKKGVRKWVFLRALISAIVLSLFIYSLLKLPLFDATVIFFIGPIFKVMIGSIVLLNENFKIADAFYSIVCFVGVILVSKPDFIFNRPVNQQDQDQHSFPIVCALTAAFMSAIAYITLKKVGRRTHVMVHVVYFGFISSLLSLVASLFKRQELVLPQPNWNELGLMISIGVLAFLGQYLLNRGLRLAPIGTVALIRTSDILFAFLFGIVLFKEIPGLYTMIGSLLVISMTTAMSINRWHRQHLRHAAIKRRRSQGKLLRQQQEQQQEQSLV